MSSRYFAMSDTLSHGPPVGPAYLYDELAGSRIDTARLGGPVGGPQPCRPTRGLAWREGGGSRFVIWGTCRRNAVAWFPITDLEAVRPTNRARAHSGWGSRTGRPGDPGPANAG